MQPARPNLSVQHAATKFVRYRLDSEALPPCKLAEELGGGGVVMCCPLSWWSLSLIFTFVGPDVCGAGISPEYGVLGSIVQAIMGQAQVTEIPSAAWFNGGLKAALQ